MRIIVSDSSCLIDLKKVSLLGAFLRLPYEITIPDTLFAEELLKFDESEKAALLTNGLKVVELSAEGVLRAQHLAGQFPALSLHDCFAFALAECERGSILLTGDNRLRSVANEQEIEVHGVLWVIDEIYEAETCQPPELFRALEKFASDRTVRLPSRELQEFIKRYQAFMK
ncbi:MAG: PIN domain-containing protein [Methylococcales bacterium]